MHKHKVKKLTLGAMIDWSQGLSSLSVLMQAKEVGTVWNDSRKVGPGDVFVALETELNDGHDFVEAAIKAGAMAAIVKKTKLKKYTATVQKKLIAVKDPLKAVQEIATRYRDELGVLFVGVTGSSGKTTTRSFISSVLMEVIPVGETYTNWNNHIGVPLSILRFVGDEWVGVIEMGANHVGEIHELSLIAKPDIAVITNVGYAHVGLFGSLENTAKAKFEIADGLSRDGFMLLNGDDFRLVKGAKERGRTTHFYGTSARCDIRAKNIKVDAKKGVSFDVDGYTFRLAMPGRHFIYAALPAIVIGRRCRIPDDIIAKALIAQKPVQMRGTVEKKKNVNFIVDCYNANPSSMKAAIDYLVDLAPESKRVAIVGDMLELGSFSKKLHKDLGKQLANAKVKKILAIGEFAKDIIDGAKKAGMKASALITIANAEDAVPVVKKEIKKGDMVLLKGSRGIHLETVFEKF